MALALTPRLLRRGLELFAVISLMGVVVVLVVFGENLQAFLSALAHHRWRCLLVGPGLASVDWIGGRRRIRDVALARAAGAGAVRMAVRDGVPVIGADLQPAQNLAEPAMA